jgi:hypothetical protein
MMEREICGKWLLEYGDWHPTPRWLVWLGKPKHRRRVYVSGPSRGEPMDYWQYHDGIAPPSSAPTA